jgi:hypothetical protein
VLHHAGSQRFGIACLVGVLAVAAGDAHAQRGSLHVLVVDANGAPVQGVEVTIPGLKRLVRTDSLGRLVFGALPNGYFDVTIRHMGYRAQSQNVLFTGTPDDSLRFTMVGQPVAVEGVDVSARSPFLAGFDQRRVRGIGTFITRDQILARNTGTTSDMFRSVPQVRLVRVPSGLGIRFQSNTFIRGKGRSMCAPMMWLDGQRAPGMEVDDIRATDIEGIELYRGVSTVPGQFATDGATQCGVVVVWTRRG